MGTWPEVADDGRDMGWGPSYPVPSLVFVSAWWFGASAGGGGEGGESFGGGIHVDQRVRGLVEGTGEGSCLGGNKCGREGWMGSL